MMAWQSLIGNHHHVCLVVLRNENLIVCTYVEIDKGDREVHIL